MTRLNFNITAKPIKSSARAASFRTLHSEVRTPDFMQGGASANVKGQTIENVEGDGARIV